MTLKELIDRLVDIEFEHPDASARPVRGVWVARKGEKEFGALAVEYDLKEKGHGLDTEFIEIL